MTKRDDVVERLRGWLDEIKLLDVDILSLEAHRHSDVGDSAIEDAEVEFEPKFGISIDNTDDDYTIRIRVRLDIEFSFGSVHAEVGLIYRSGQRPVEAMGDDEMQLFINDVAFMSAFPYLRAEVGGLSGKLFKRPLTLPVVQRGDVTFSPSPNSLARSS